MDDEKQSNDDIAVRRHNISIIGNVRSTQWMQYLEEKAYFSLCW